MVGGKGAGDDGEFDRGHRAGGGEKDVMSAILGVGDCGEERLRLSGEG